MQSARHRLSDPNDLSLNDFAQQLRRGGFIDRLLNLARDEDMGVPARDLTGELMFAPSDTREVLLRARQDGIAAGLAFMPDLIAVFSAENDIEHEIMLRDGDAVRAGVTMARLKGNAREIVAMERTMLNLLSRMCGIATLTSAYVDLVAGTSAKICDTRKTTPGLRVLEKYAVRCGGGTTHRMGLHDAVLIKDNHIAGLSEKELATKLPDLTYTMTGSDAPIWFVQVEVDSLDQLRAVLSAESGMGDIVLLDNMTPEMLREAVAIRDESGVRVLLEASGGVNQRTVRAIAETGVERISVGSLTHQAQSIDLGLDSVSAGA
ncbi:MAG: carboxylating nicotinate-nucleotide diphosphorylase [Phycisphaerales bacterium]|nr:carboxylating nicotinate-nucleotide diphosphorylase [Phycisphaerales bacterium]